MSGNGTTPRTRFLLIGLGKRGIGSIYPALSPRRMGRFSVTAVCDSDSTRRAEFIDAVVKLKPRVTAAYFSSLRDVPLSCFDAAVVATPTDQHHSIVEHLVGSNVRAILIEKPVAPTFETARRIIQLSSRVQVLADRRYLKSFKLVQSLVPDLGLLREFEGFAALASPEYKHTWRNDPRRAGGGVLLDLGYHLIDMCIALLGAPEDVLVREYSPRRRGYRVEEDVEMTLRFACQSATLRASRLQTRRRESYVLVGEHGTIRWSRRRVLLSVRGREFRWLVDDPTIGRIRRMVTDKLTAASELRLDTHALSVHSVIAAMYSSLRERQHVSIARPNTPMEAS